MAMFKNPLTGENDLEPRLKPVEIDGPNHENTPELVGVGDIPRRIEVWS